MKKITTLLALAALFSAVLECKAEIVVTSSATLVAFPGDPDVDNLDGTEIVLEMTFPTGTVWEESTVGRLNAVASTATLTFNGTPVVFNAGELPLSYLHITENLRRGIRDGNGSGVLNFSVFDDSVNTSSGLIDVDQVISVGDPLQTSDFVTNLVRSLVQIQDLNGTFYNMTDFEQTVVENLPPPPSNEIVVTSSATLFTIAGPDVDNLDGTEIVLEMTFPEGTVWEDSTFGQPGLKAVASSATLTFNGTQVVFNAGELPLSYVHIDFDPDNLRRGIIDGNGIGGLSFSVFGDDSVNTSAGILGVDQVISVGDPLQTTDFVTNLVQALLQIQNLNGSFYNMTDFEQTVVENLPPPSNDDYFGPLVSFPFNEMGTNVNATTEMDEQQLENTGSTVWWYFVAPDDGTVTIDTFGSDFDTQLHIYTGFDMGFANLIPVANNDDTGGFQSQVEFPVEAGECYDIRVGGWHTSALPPGSDGAEGSIMLQGTFSPEVIPGDVNCDGVVNLLDVAPFVEAISIGQFNAKADINDDGMVNLLDVGPFVSLLSGDG